MIWIGIALGYCLFPLTAFVTFAGWLLWNTRRKA